MVPGGIIVLDDLDRPNCPGVSKALEERGLLALVEKTAPHQGRLVKAAPTEANVSLSVRANGEQVVVVSDAQADSWEGVADACKALKALKCVSSR